MFQGGFPKAQRVHQRVLGKVCSGWQERLASLPEDEWAVRGARQELLSRAEKREAHLHDEKAAADEAHRVWRSEADASKPILQRPRIQAEVRI